MSGLLGTLQIARSGVVAQQTAVRVASQNITNAETEGYTRQRAQLVTARPTITPLGSMGAGVRVADVTRLRDSLLDANFRRDSGRAASSQFREEVLGQVQLILGEPTETGIMASLDAFHDAWSDLASNPTNAPIRGLVVQRGDQLATMLRSFSGRLDETRTYAEDRLASTIEDVNRLSGQIALINTDIVRVEAGGQTATDLRDQRDLLIDKMAKLGSVRVIERDMGDVAVLIDGAMVVDGAGHNELSTSGSPAEVFIGSRAVAFRAGPSMLGDLLTIINTDIPAVQQRLDDLAAGMVAQVNALHRSGYTRTGATNVDFFDPAGTTASSIRVVAGVDDVVTADLASQPANNRIALAMAALRGRPSENVVAGNYAAWTAVQNNLGGESFSEHYTTTVVDLASLVNDAENASSVYAALADQAMVRRESVSGVSVDEELILVMQHQQAYTAAARLVNVIDEMMQTLLQM